MSHEERNSPCSCHGVKKKYDIEAGDAAKRIRAVAWAEAVTANATTNHLLDLMPTVKDLGVYGVGQLKEVVFHVAALDPDFHNCQITQPDVYAYLYAAQPLRVAVLAPDGSVEVVALSQVPGGTFWDGTWLAPDGWIGEYRFRLHGTIGDLHGDHTESDDPDLAIEYRATLTVGFKVDIAEFDRVVPGERNEKLVTVTTTPSPLPGGASVALSIVRTSGNEGSASIIEPASATITQTTAIKIRGTQQSWGSGDNPAPNNLRLRATFGSRICDEEPFTVCAHAQDCTNTLLRAHLRYGLRVTVWWASDSGNCNDLSRVAVREHLVYSRIPNPPFCDPDGSDMDKSGQTIDEPPVLGVWGDKGTVRDTHRHGWGVITRPPTTGRYTVAQIYQSQCRRCSDSVWRDMTNYLITHEIYDTDPGPAADLWFKTSKTGPGGPFVSDEDIPRY